MLEEHKHADTKITKQQKTDKNTQCLNHIHIMDALKQSSKNHAKSSVQNQWKNKIQIYFSYN